MRIRERKTRKGDMKISPFWKNKPFDVKVSDLGPGEEHVSRERGKGRENPQTDSPLSADAAMELPPSYDP